MLKKWNIIFLYSIKVSKKTLKFDSAEVNKEFRVSEPPIALDSVLINKKVVSKKFEYSDTGFKYFIGYKDNNTVRPLCIVYLKCVDA